MQCNICGGDCVRAREHHNLAGPAPAFVCTQCHALNLDEEFVRSSKERSSMRIAVAQRAWALAAATDFGTTKTAC